MNPMQPYDFFAPDGESPISSEEAQVLNRNLSRQTAKDIPEEKRVLVLDYLITALNMNSVELDSKPGIERLVSELQQEN